MIATNQTLRRIQELDEQIKALTKIIERGEYVAAGLDISLTVGKREDVNHDLRLELCWYLEKIVPAMLESLQQSRKQALSSLRAEFNEVSMFLEAQR